MGKVWKVARLIEIVSGMSSTHLRHSYSQAAIISLAPVLLSLCT